MAQGLRFNGLTDSAQLLSTAQLLITDAITLDLTFTCSAAIGSSQTILSRNGPYAINYIPDSGKFRVDIFAGGAWSSAMSTRSFPVRQSVRITAIYDGSAILLYLDGVLDATTPKTGLMGSIGRMFLGYPPDVGYQSPLYGSVAYVRIYNRALAASEVAANYAGTVTRSGLVGEWLFQEGTGTTAFDTSGNGNNGTIVGATWVQKKRRQGLSFNGVTDYVEINDNSSLQLTNNFALEITFLAVTQTGPTKYLLNKGANDYVIYWDSNSVIRLFALNYTGVSPSSASAISLTPDNSWHTVRYEYDGVTLKGYLDDVLKLSTAITFAFNSTSTGKLRIGNSVVADYYTGAISSVKITKNGLNTARYLLNEGTGTTVSDTSGNGNHGTITGAAWLMKNNPQKPKKNMFNESSWGLRTVESGNAVLRFNGYYSVDTGVISGTPLVLSSNVKSNTTYTFSGRLKKTTWYNNIVVFYTDNSMETKGGSIDNYGYTNLTFTTGSKPVKAILIDSGAAAADGYALLNTIQLEEGAAMTAYEPYKPIDGSKPAASKPKKQMLPPFTDPRWTLHENTRMQVADFSGKVAGSTVACPHKAQRTATGVSGVTTLQNPITGTWIEYDAAFYSAISSLDGNITAINGVTNNGGINQNVFSFDVIEHIIRKFGASVFGSAVTLADRIAWVKAGNVAKFYANWTGFGSGPLGNKANFRMWRQSDSTWIGTGSNTASTPTLLNYLDTFPTDKIDANGFVHYLAYADASDGITASVINTDKVNLEVYLTEAAYTPLRQAYTLGLNANSSFQQSTVIVPAVGGQTYTFLAKTAGYVSGTVRPYITIEALDANQSVIGSNNGFAASSPGDVLDTYTLPSNAAFIRAYLNNQGAGQFTFINPQLEMGSAATAFEAYQLLPDNKLIPLVPKKNMLPPFTDSAWTLHENTRMQVADFSGKVTGSTVECPHIGYAASAAPSAGLIETAGSEFAQSSYNQIGILEGTIKTSPTLVNGDSERHRFSFNVVEHIARKFGDSVFGNARTLAERIAWVKAGNVARVMCSWNGFGSGPLGNKAYLRVWNGSSWVGSQSNISSSVSRLSDNTTGVSVPVVIDTNGFFHALAYSDASDGITASTINTDAVNFEVYLTEAAYAPLRQAYTLRLNATAAQQVSYYDVPVVLNRAYTFNVTTTSARIDVNEISSAGVNVTPHGTVTLPFTVTVTDPNVAFIRVLMSNAAVGQFTFDKPQLEKGSVATAFENYTLIPNVKQL